MATASRKSVKSTIRPADGSAAVTPIMAEAADPTPAKAAATKPAAPKKAAAKPVTKAVTASAVADHPVVAKSAAPVKPAEPASTKLSVEPVAPVAPSLPKTAPAEAAADLAPVVKPAQAAPVPVAAQPAVPAKNLVSMPVPAYLPPPPILPQKVTKMAATAFKGYEDFTAFGKDNFDAFVKANTVLAKGFEDLGKEFMSLTQANVENAASAAKAMFSAKTLKDVVELNTELTKASIEKMVANSSKLSEMGLKVTTEAFAPINARVNVAVEKLLKPTIA